MPLRIFNNLVSSNAQRFLGGNSTRVGESVQRVASGLRINRAADDLASFAISENLRADTRVLQQASRNANDGISLLSTAEGSLNDIYSIIIRLRELAGQSSTGTIGAEQRRALNLEANSQIEEIDRIAATAEFGGQKLLDGSLASNAGNQISLAIGLDSSDNSLINLNQKVNITAVDSSGLGIEGLDLSTADTAVTSFANLESALEKVNEIRGRLGAMQNVVAKTAANLDSNVTSFSQAQSSLKDADIGREFALLTRNQLLLQSASAMVGQANLIPRSVLQLLQ